MKKILIINASYYKSITDRLLSSAIKYLRKKKVSFRIIEVPGIFEIPFIIRKNIKKYQGFIALGCVIKGQTPHFDFISISTFQSLQNLTVNFNKPISNGIITALNQKQAKERSSNIKSKKINKGLEAAKAVISILNNG